MLSNYLLKPLYILVVLPTIFGFLLLSSNSADAELIKKKGELHISSLCTVRVEPMEWRQGKPAYITLTFNNTTDAKLAVPEPLWTKFEFDSKDRGLRLWGERYSGLAYLASWPVKSVSPGETLTMRYPAFLFFRRPDFGRHKVNYSIEMNVDEMGERKQQAELRQHYHGYFHFKFKQPQKPRPNKKKIKELRSKLQDDETHDEAFQQLLFLNSKSAARVLVEMCSDGELKSGERNILMARLARFEPALAVKSLAKVVASSGTKNEWIANYALHTMTRIFGYREEVREQVRDALLEAIKTDRPIIQSNAVIQLGSLGYQDAKDEIRALLDDDKARVRKAAAAALGQLREERQRNRDRP